MRRPVPVATGAAVLLIALGAPFLTIRFTGIDPSVLPSRPARADRRRRDQDRVPAERDLAGLHRVRRAGRRRCARTRPGCPRRSRRRGSSEARIDLIAPGAAAERRGQGLRARGAGGAGAVRARRRRADRGLPRPAGARCAPTCPPRWRSSPRTTLIILFFMTRSVVLPVKALVMNLLSLCAAFGLLVLVFQDGHLEWLLRLRQPGRDRVLAARAAVRGRVRALDRLRRVPARAHQGAARRRASPMRRRSRSACSGRAGS